MTPYFGEQEHTVEKAISTELLSGTLLSTSQKSAPVFFVAQPVYLCSSRGVVLGDVAETVAKEERGTL